MLIFKALGGSVERLVGEIDLAFEWRQKSRLRTAIDRGTRAGVEVGFDLPRGTVLRDGDLIATDSGDTLRVHAAPEELLHITAVSALALARIGYHLGNRHVPVQLGDGWIRLQYDHVLEGMVRGLGGVIELVDDSFDPEGGAYAGGGHSHAHSHDHPHDDHHPDHRVEEPARSSGQHADARHSPRIHDFLTEPLKR